MEVKKMIENKIYNVAMKLLKNEGYKLLLEDKQYLKSCVESIMDDEGINYTIDELGDQLASIFRMEQSNS
jgi:hypothetical protein